MTSAEVRQLALALPEAERISLIDALWESLATEGEREQKRKSIEETNRRIEAVRRGEMKTYPLVDVLDELRNRHKQ